MAACLNLSRVKRSKEGCGDNKANDGGSGSIVELGKKSSFLTVRSTAPLSAFSEYDDGCKDTMWLLLSRVAFVAAFDERSTGSCCTVASMLRSSLGFF
jgi:hypothetical protein